MKPTRFPAAVLVALVSLVLAGTAIAMHTTFSASVDRFEVDGNAFGPADGVPDQVDDFDDGDLEPNWDTLLGTAVESGGVLTVKNPGVDVELVPGYELDISNVENETHVVNGGGDFTATSYWVPTLPALNTGFHFQLYQIGATDVEAAGLLFNNSDASTAHGDPVGYSIAQEVTFINNQGVPQHDAVAVDPSSVTGAIVFRMAFDDATDTLTTSFSLDGGATFKSPFPPLHIFQVVSEHEILLGAAHAQSTLGPPPGGCVSVVKPKLGVQRLNKPAGVQGLRFSGRVPYVPGEPLGFDPVATGASIALAPFTGGAGVWTQSVPAGALGTGCDPRDGWKRSPGGYLYHNASNAIPPGCTPGSANGLVGLKVRDGRARQGRVDFNMTVRKTAVGRPNGVVTGGIVFGQAVSGNNCGDVHLVCRHTAATSTCQ